MLIELILFLLLGILAGTITGLIPGIHINLIGIFLVSVSASLLFFIDPIYLIVFIEKRKTSTSLFHKEVLRF